jgi:cytochrome c
MKLTASLPAILVVAVLVAGVGMIVLRLFSPTPDETVSSVTVPRLSAVAKAGKDGFDANCAQCHGENGAGTRQGPPLIHDIYNPGHHGDQAFFRAVALGVPRHHWSFGDMPAQPDVKAEELAAIVRYVREMQEANGIFRKPHRM